MDVPLDRHNLRRAKIRIVLRRDGFVCYAWGKHVELSTDDGTNAYILGLVDALTGVPICVPAATPTEKTTANTLQTL